MGRPFPPGAVGALPKQSLRVVTGQRKSTPVETRRREAVICSITTASKRATALAYEKAQLLHIDHPRRQISRHRLKRPNLRSAAQASTSHLPAELAHRAPIDSPISCPWKTQANGVYTPATWHLRAPKMTPHLAVIHQTSDCSFHHLKRWLGNSEDFK